MHEAETFVTKERIWSKSFPNKTSAGEKVYYRCRLVKSRGVQCAAGLYLLYHSNNSKISLFRATNEHTCDQITTVSTIVIDPKVQSTVRDLLVSKHMKPNAILDVINRDTEIVIKPSKNQVNNIVSSIRKELNITMTISLSKLNDLIEPLTNVPEDLEKCFVAAYEWDTEPIPFFRILLTSKTLLLNCTMSDIVVCDATYKLLFSGYPLIVVGTVDMHKHFHLIAVALVSTETTDDYQWVFENVKTALFELLEFTYEPKILMSDAAIQIKKAFLNAFGHDKITKTCNFHVKKAIDLNLNRHVKAKEERTQIKADFDLIQSSSSLEQFELGVKLFIEKWGKYPSFVEYFDTQWVKKVNDWWSGKGDPIKAPGTDNALEAFNGTIKKERTFRDRMLVQPFLDAMVKMVEDKSLRYKHGQTVFEIEPKITLKDWQGAYAWNKEKKEVKKKRVDGNFIYYVASGDSKSLPPNYDKIPTCRNFEKYKEKAFRSFKVTLSEKGAEHSTCTCVSFYKNYVCKHILGLGARLDMWAFPKGSKNVQLEPKRKRGRPKKASKALIID